MVCKISFDNPIWKTPLLPQIPDRIQQSHTGKIPLSNRSKPAWQFLFESIDTIPSAYETEQDFSFDSIPEDRWQQIIVPSSLIMQGFDIQNNVEYYYRRQISIPEAFQGQRVFIRFEGVYSNARVWINNRFISSHVGGFTAWDCDITEFSSDKEVVLIVGVTDTQGSQKGVWNPQGIPLSNSAWASYYAHCNIGGIIRDVTLFALPNNYIARSHLDTQLQKDKGILHIDFELHACAENIQICTQVIDKAGCIAATVTETVNNSFIDGSFYKKNYEIAYKKSWIRKNIKSYQNDCKYSSLFLDTFHNPPPDCEVYCFRLSISVDNPLLWDSEHPNLYTLKTVLVVNGKTVQENRCNFGFREITYGGKNATAKNKIYVNGSEIKLRGVCRHDVSQYYGRSLTKEDIYQEILTYKQHNINHIRTSHYPASDDMLSVCDELGIYVEQENAACFKGANSFPVNNPPQDFITSLGEMVESSRNHPSVIIWSVANESGFEKSYGFRAAYDYVKAADPSRPVIFSYPHTVHSKPAPYDIASHHYKAVTSALGKKEIPLLHDEFAHVPCYNLAELAADNSCREFWGESIQKGWENIYRTDGALGCAIWGGVDDVFYLPEHTKERHQTHGKGSCAGYGEWGCIFDACKRLKPEAYLTKKAFSPVLLDKAQSKLTNQKIRLFLKNRFDHTTLSEVTMVCTASNGQILYDTFLPQSIQPHSSGVIEIPNEGHSKIKIEFYHNGYCIDTYHLGERRPVSTRQPNQAFYADIAEQSGLILIKDNNSRTIAQGPYLFVKTGKKVTCTVKKLHKKNNAVTASLVCSNGMRFRIKSIIDPNGLQIQVTPAGVVTSLRSVHELGIYFLLRDKVHAVEWNRKPFYCTYPEHHIGRASSCATVSGKTSPYSTPGICSWEEETANYFLYDKQDTKNRIASNDFKTKRYSILDYTVIFESGQRLAVSAEQRNTNAYVNLMGSDSQSEPRLEISLGHYCPSLQWGNYLGEKTTLRKLRFQCNLCCPGLKEK